MAGMAMAKKRRPAMRNGSQGFRGNRGERTAIGYVRVATGQTQADEHAQEAGAVAIDGWPPLLRRFHGAVNRGRCAPRWEASRDMPGGEQITSAGLASLVHGLHAVAALGFGLAGARDLSVVKEAAATFGKRSAAGATAQRHQVVGKGVSLPGIDVANQALRPTFDALDALADAQRQVL